jgi:hypothetical protein
MSHGRAFTTPELVAVSTEKFRMTRIVAATSSARPMAGASRSATSAGPGGERYAQAAEYLAFVAEQEGIGWSLPMPTLARLLVTVIDGLSLNWLPDRDSAAALGVLDAFAAHLATLAVPPGTPG